MQSFEPTNEDITRYYATAIDALYEIGKAYFTFGKLGNAQYLFRTALPLLEAREVKPGSRLKFFLLYGQVILVDHLLTHGGSRRAEPRTGPLTCSQTIWVRLQE